MHYYQCPYCQPCRESYLEKTPADDLEYVYEECDDDDCNNIIQYTCNKCYERFLGTDNFLKEQKRKIKDG
jgi:hypothetical protein